MLLRSETYVERLTNVFRLASWETSLVPSWTLCRHLTWACGRVRLMQRLRRAQLGDAILQDLPAQQQEQEQPQLRAYDLSEPLSGFEMMGV